GIQTPTRFAPKVSALQHMIAQNQMRANDGGAPKYSDEEIEAARSPDFKEWDWEDFMFSNALQTNHTVSISGGTDVQNYYVSFGYFNQDGIFLNSSYKKFNIQLNQSIQATKKLNISYRLGYVPSTRTAPASVNWDIIAQTSRLIGIRTDDGKWLTHPERTGTGRNPLYSASEDGGQQLLKRNQLVGNVTAEYEVVPDLFITGTYGMNNAPTRTRTYTKLLTFWDQYNPDQIASTTDYNILDVNNSSSTQQNVSLIAKYGKTLNDHRFSVLAGVTSEWYEQHNDRVNTRDFLTDELYVIDAGTRDKTLWTISGSASDWALASVISRATYSYKGRYLLEGAMRYDGSSRFKEDIRWGLFPSASAGWIISEENFLKDNAAIDFLKLRGSWGQVGNQNVGFYPFANVLSQSSAYFGGSPYRSVTTTGAPNPLLTWETKEAVNLGLEGTLFNSLLEFNVEVFKEQTKDILLNLPLPTTFGQAAPVQNAGRVDNMGWEAELEHRHTIGDFGYDISVQVSDATNKVIDMEGISPIISGNQITEEGHPMDEWYGLRADGLFQTDEEVKNHPFQNPITSPGDIRYQDHGGDPNTITSDDRVRLGRSDARYPFGIRLNISYKNFDFTAFGQGVMYNLIYSHGPTATNFDAESTTIRDFHLDAWSPDNRDARFPKFRNNQATGINEQFSSFWLQNASYFRLKAIQLGYNVPANLLRRISLKKARIYASAEDLFVITDYIGFDPEMPNAANYPLPRVVNFGVNLEF
ncbi:MAG TPA: SusC/RagA family TonB-linked outer membrane protein, partial [Chryseosolibacter sp.]|nr:SusC/RagA family TonB-linked outer membrane protein [Chryseosolibacter sp.]